MPQRKFMELAIEEARNGIAHGQTPFGACIVKGDSVIARGHNRVWETTDITAHAEMVAIRQACRKLGTIDLSGCDIYATTEPCPMCFGAIHWAGIGKVFYGTGIADAAKAGFNEIALSNADMARMGRSNVKSAGGLLRDECMALFEEFLKRPERKVY